MDLSQVPLGFGMALARNAAALAAYAAMPEKEREHVLGMAHNAQSREEMQRIVDHLADGSAF